MVASVSGGSDIAKVARQAIIHRRTSLNRESVKFTNGLKPAFVSNRGIHNMKQYVCTFFAGLVLTGISLGVTACQQAPAPVAAAPTDTTTPVAASTPPQVIIEEKRPRVVEENRPRVAVDVDIHKQQDRDHVAVDLHARP